MVVPLPGRSHARRTIRPSFRDVSYRSHCDFSCACAGDTGAREWDSKEIPALLPISGLHALQQLFYDYNLPDAGAQTRLELGPINCNWSLRAANMVGAAFRFDAFAEVISLLYRLRF